MRNPTGNFNNVVETAKSPEEWCEKLKKRGIQVSPRTLRAKARKHGQFLSLGRAMVLNLQHIEHLMSVEAYEVRAQNRVSSEVIVGKILTPNHFAEGEK